MAYEQGVCSFCGTGGGHLGDQGDERSQHLHGAVRKGEPGTWEYERHPNADDSGTVLWCGNCISGLTHKFQRYDDTNLRAKYLSYKVRLEMDGLRWSLWDASEGAEREALQQLKDDPSIHLEKLGIERELYDMQQEMFRRAGFDLTTRDWRP